MMIRTIGLIVTLALGLFAGSLPADAQQTGKVYRVGFLSGRSASSNTDPHRVAFRQRLRELGYIEGQNLVMEYLFAEGKRGRLPDLAAEMVRRKVDVIMTGAGPPVVRAAKQATRTIPIVMAAVQANPVAAGFVESLARPGGNITGITNLQTELRGKSLALLKEGFPQISRVAILGRERQERRGKKQIEAAAAALNIQIRSVAARALDDYESIFSAISRESPDALLVTTFPLVRDHPEGIIDFTAERRLPTIYASSGIVDVGGLMSYSADMVDLYQRAAIYVHKILKGAKPGDLPVERPTKFDFVINLKTAKKLGFTIPPNVLYRATKVIK